MFRRFLATFLVFAAVTQAELNTVKGIIFDMDGVLRVGFNAVEGASDLIAWMDQEGMPGMILTNECRYTEKRIRQDLHEMGISIPDSWPVYTAAHAVRDFIDTQLPFQSKLYVYVVGLDGLRQAINDVQSSDVILTDLFPQTRGPDDELLVVFGAVDRIRIEDLERASHWIHQGARVLMTCSDVADPAGKGETLIGMPGHMVHILKMHAPCAPYSVGKPNPFMARRAREILEKTAGPLADDEILFVGDSLDTDIQLAFQMQIQSALVLTGNARAESVTPTICRPSYVFDGPKTLLSELRSKSPPSS